MLMSTRFLDTAISSLKMLINWNTVTRRVAFAVASQLYYCKDKKSKECCEIKSCLFKKSRHYLANRRIANICGWTTPLLYASSSFKTAFVITKKCDIQPLYNLVLPDKDDKFTLVFIF